MTTGTHWPNLVIGPEVPASDKTIHVAAFAGLTILMWMTRWIPSLAVVGAVMIAWAVLDELSQGIPILGRTVSLYDMAANVLGVTVAAALIWTFMRMTRV